MNVAEKSKADATMVEKNVQSVRYHKIGFQASSCWHASVCWVKNVAAQQPLYHMSIDAMVDVPALYANDQFSNRQRISCNLCNRRMHLALAYAGAPV